MLRIPTQSAEAGHYRQIGVKVGISPEEHMESSRPRNRALGIYLRSRVCAYLSPKLESMALEIAYPHRGLSLRGVDVQVEIGRGRDKGARQQFPALTPRMERYEAIPSPCRQAHPVHCVLAATVAVVHSDLAVNDKQTRRRP